MKMMRGYQIQSSSMISQKISCSTSKIILMILWQCRAGLSVVQHSTRKLILRISENSLLKNLQIKTRELHLRKEVARLSALSIGLNLVLLSRATLIQTSRNRQLGPPRTRRKRLVKRYNKELKAKLIKKKIKVKSLIFSTRALTDSLERGQAGHVSGNLEQDMLR